MPYLANGPVLGSKKRAQPTRVLPALALSGVALLAGWLSLRVIGSDLMEGRHIHATHKEEAKPDVAPAQAVQGTGAAKVTPGAPGTPPAPQRVLTAPTVDPVAQALLAAGRDHLARKVAATALPVDDARALKGAGIDLIDRGLEHLLSLRQALPRHRALSPQLYGLHDKPTASADERRRALTAENLMTFLQTFAKVLDGARDSLEGGDIVLLERKHGVHRLLPAIVSDVVDADGVALVMTLDPADRVAREQPLATYRVMGHFRLRAVDIERARLALDMAQGPVAGTPL